MTDEGREEEEDYPWGGRKAMIKMKVGGGGGDDLDEAKRFARERRKKNKHKVSQGQHIPIRRASRPADFHSL